MIKNRRNKTEERKKNVREKYQVKCNHDYLHQEYARVNEWREIKHFISFHFICTVAVAAITTTVEIFYFFSSSSSSRFDLN